MGRKKLENPVNWKPVRIQKEWLDMLRAAGQKNPSFSPTVDLTTASEPKLLHLACQVAALYISGWFWERLTPDLDHIVELSEFRGAVRVAAHFGATVQRNADHSLTITAPDHEHTLSMSPQPGFPKPIFH